jgi:hypothetical protein
MGRRSVQIEAGTADEAGKGVALGRMTDEARRFVDDQQAGVFVEDVEQFFQTRGILTAKHAKHTKEDGIQKAEFRKPKEGRRSKSESKLLREGFPVRASDLGFLSGFGFRISEFSRRLPARLHDNFIFALPMIDFHILPSSFCIPRLN